MMLRYGDLDASHNTPHVLTDVSEIVEYAYDQWSTIIKDAPYSWMPRNVYEAAEELVRPFEDTLKQVVEFEKIKLHTHLPNITYLQSAFFNASGISEYIKSDVDAMAGFRLPADKTIELYTDTLFDFGHELQGTLINHKIAESLGTAGQGVIVNYGTAYSLGVQAKDGVYIHAKTKNSRSEYFGNAATGGLFVNYGYAHTLLENSHNTFSLNFGSISRYLPGVSGGMHINLGGVGTPFLGTKGNAITVHAGTKKYTDAPGSHEQSIEFDIVGSAIETPYLHLIPPQKSNVASKHVPKTDFNTALLTWKRDLFDVVLPLKDLQGEKIQQVAWMGVTHQLRDLQSRMEDIAHDYLYA